MSRAVGPASQDQVLAPFKDPVLTIVATCALHGIEPRAYIADVIVRVNQPGVTVDELLPWNWKPAG